MSDLPPDWLVGTTTYREYIDRFLGSVVGDVPPKMLAQAKERAAQVAAKMQPGDELWEWHHRGGPFSSSGGLAILRGGSVVEWWREWVS